MVKLINLTMSSDDYYVEWDRRNKATMLLLSLGQKVIKINELRTKAASGDQMAAELVAAYELVFLTPMPSFSD